MSIIGAATVGAVAGKVASGLIFKYTQSVYQDKINELDGVIAKLNTHLNNLNRLRNEMPTFWDDENARGTLQSIDITIDKVTRQMETAKSLAQIFRETVTSLESSKANVHGYVDDALGLLNSIDLV